MSYQSVKLGDVCEVLSGYAWTAAKFNTDKIGMPVIRIQNVASVMDCDFVYWDEGYDERFVIRTGDIVLTLSGSFRVESWKGPDALLNQRIVKLTPSSKLDQRWFLNVLQTRLSEIGNLGRHALVNNVSISDIKNLDIPAPPLPEQRRIAAILDQADALRAKRREALVQLDRLTQSIFIEMFGPAKSKDWPVTTIENVVAQKLGGIRTGPFGSQLLHSEFVASGIAVLGIDNAVANEFRWGERRYITEEKYHQLKRYKVAPGDVLITIMGTCGRCAVVPDDIPVAINTKHLCCISLNQEVCLPKFLHAYFLQHPIAREYLARTAKGAIMAGLNMGLIKAMPLVLPPLELQHSFVSRGQAIERQKALSVAALAELDALFSSIQYRAFRGEL